MSEHDLSERVDALASWIQDLDAQLNAASLVGDGKKLKELAKALEAWNKHDPKLEERVTNRVDVLADRLETLSGTVTTTAASLAGKDGEIARLRRELEEGHARIEATVRELRQVGSGVDLSAVRREIAALSAEKLSKSGDKRVDRMTGELDVLAQRLDTLSKTVSTTAAGLAGREGELAALRARLEQGDAQADTVIRELRSSLDSLARQVDELGERPRDTRATELFGALLDELHGKVEQLATQLGAVSGSVATASAGIAANEADLARFQRRFEEARVRVDAMIVELHETVASLPTAGAVEEAVEEQLRTFGLQVEGAVEHVARLEAATKARLAHATSATADLERVLSEVAGRLASLEQERDTVATALNRATEAWSEERTWVRGQLEALAAAVDEIQGDDSLKLEILELAGRIEAIEYGHEAVGAERTWIRGQLEALAAAVDQVQAADDSIKPEIVQLAGRIEAIEHGHEVVGAERTWIRGQLEALAAAVDQVQAADGLLAPEIAELAGRIEAIEHGHESVGAELARVAAALDAERGDLKSELDALATSLAAVPADAHVPTNEHAERMVNELARRLDEMELESSTVAAEIAQAQTFWASEIAALERRLEQVAAAAPAGGFEIPPELAGGRVDELARRLEALELDREQAASGSIEEVEELRDLRVLINGLRMRLASNEKELAALTSAGDVSTRLDELSMRLSALERTSIAAVAMAAPTPVPGDGRFRVELRGLEQRMHSLEESARENRDAVLLQFERLASRLQWRVQQLEMESADAAYGPAKPAPRPLGQVVPIRGDG
jgi:chromosome segregation ATPase